MSDDWKPPTADDVTDLALLPRRFDALVFEVRDGFRSVADKLERILDHMKQTARDLDDLDRRVRTLEPPPYVPKLMRSRK
jgi:hypothetical protein